MSLKNVFTFSRLDEAGIEKKTAKKAGSAPARRHSDEEFSVDMKPEDELELSAHERRKPPNEGDPGMDFSEWNARIEEYLRHLTKIKKGKEGAAMVQAFRNTENRWSHTQDEAGRTDLRERAWEDGTTYDSYILTVAQYSGFPHSADALRTKLRMQYRQRRALGTKEPELLKRGGSSNFQYDPAEIEMLTPEFAEFRKWAENVWKKYGVDEQGNPIAVDEKSWEETLRYFASTGHRYASKSDAVDYGSVKVGKAHEPAVRRPSTPESDEPDWEELLKQRQASGKLGTMNEIAVEPDPDQEGVDQYADMIGKQSNEPLYKWLMRADVGMAGTIFVNQVKKNMQANQRISSQNQQQIDKYGQRMSSMSPDMKQGMADYHREKGSMVPFGKETQPEQEPEMYKNKNAPPEQDREKRKFPTWWDLGFKGDIPFSRM